MNSIEAITSYFAQDHIYCPIYIIDALLSEGIVSERFQDKLHKHFMREAYILSVYFLAVDLFRQDLSVLQEVYIKTIKPLSYVPNIIMSEDSSIHFSIKINDYDKMLVGRLFSKNCPFLVVQHIISLNRRLCLNFPYLYTVENKIPPLIEVTIKDRLTPILKEKKLSHGNLELEYFSLEEYIDGIPLSQVPDDAMESVLQQVSLAMKIASSMIKHEIKHVDESCIVCRVLRKETNIRYILDNEVIWVKSEYLPMIVKFARQASNFIRNIPDFKYNTATPARGILWRESNETPIVLNGLPKFKTQFPLPTSMIQVLYRFYSKSDIVDPTRVDPKLLRLQKLLDARYKELVTAKSLVKAISKEDDRNYQIAMIRIINKVLARLQFISISDKIMIKRLINELSD